MGHLLKIKSVDSIVNVPFLASTSVQFTHEGASAKFSTNSHETDNADQILFERYPKKFFFQNLHFSPIRKVPRQFFKILTFYRRHLHFN
jgi:hypothetical protein